jgi:imidazolonepropionase
VTHHAAQALGLQATHGRIVGGYPANFVLWNVGDVAELAYWLGQRPACSVVRQGRLAVDGMGLHRSAA